jgi:hypothetical protein
MVIEMSHSRWDDIVAGGVSAGCARVSVPRIASRRADRLFCIVQARPLMAGTWSISPIGRSMVATARGAPVRSACISGAASGRCEPGRTLADLMARIERPSCDDASG